MITVAEAEQVLATLRCAERIEQRPLSEAVGCVLAAPVRAQEASPPFSNSAMDGYAIRFADYQQLGESTAFTIVGESAAGHPYEGSIPPGGAVKISTGAPLPADADTVVPIEDVTVYGDRVHVEQPPRKGQHVKVAGTEFAPGAGLIDTGQLLLPPHLALIASQGIAQVTVYAPPRVAILVSGDELVDITAKPQFGQIRDSNSLMLRLVAEQAGTRVVQVRRVLDQLAATIAAVEAAVAEADIVISSGGVSVGEHDHIRAALQRLEFEELFWRIKQKPGKPMFAAARSGKWFFGLPGNPVSAYICFVHYLYPLLRRWQRHPHPHLDTVDAVLAQDVQNAQDRLHFVRVCLRRKGEMITATPLPRQASYMLTTIADADGYVKVEPRSKLPAGTKVTAHLFPGVVV